MDDPVEVLDAAAVEAALSLCEEAVAGGHSLSDPWETEAFKSVDPDPISQTRVPTNDSLASSVCLPVPSPGPVVHEGEAATEVAEKAPTEAPEMPTNVPEPVAPPRPGNTHESEIQSEDTGNEEDAGAKEEEQIENRSPSPSVKCESEEWPQPELETPCLDSEDSSVSGRDPKVGTFFTPHPAHRVSASPNVHVLHIF